MPAQSLLIVDRAFIDYGQFFRFANTSTDRHWLVRIMHCQLDGAPQRLMTSWLDADRWPANEVVAMYHERWEIEITFGELKTHMLQRKVSLRSKSPVGVCQEIWGLLLAYNLIRYRRARAARKLELQRRAMSFVFSLCVTRAFLIATAWDTSPANIPLYLETLDRELESATLLARRSHRPMQASCEGQNEWLSAQPRPPSQTLEFT